MAVLSKKEYDNMTNEQLLASLDPLTDVQFKPVDTDTKVRYFLFKFGDTFAEAIKGTGLFFAGMVAQSIGESNFGKSGLALEANNFAGIKSKGGDYVTRKTMEVVKGKKVYIDAKFAKFATPQDGVKAHINTLMQPRYDKARLNAKSPEEQLLMIVQSGYATLPAKEYVNNVKGNISRIQKKIPIGRVV